ncbi:MAG: HAD-IC family P-type ATPase [Gemmatimonadetes bacterium]|nr:HAD-IC family P-type ATPase [Gemmatimonadota bacterium]MBT5589527.1 HAD-IC family P-type ATPase [Gemmatimonadota bacterium]
MTTSPPIPALVCDHCGQSCLDTRVEALDRLFCCHGCRTVFEILQDNGLTHYYRLEDRPGIRLDNAEEHASRFSYLDDETLQAQLLDFSNGVTATITLRLPQIHCASCVWLLENLRRLEPAVAHSEVDFLRRELAVTYQVDSLSLRRLVERLASIGYEPEITLDATTPKTGFTQDPLLRKIGIAGFCFGNAMLFSLPEYFADPGELNTSWQRLFSGLNLVLALPVLLYSSTDYLRGALRSLSQATTTIDVPIALGIVALFSRSLYEIVSGAGPGYMDSFTGLVFFLLLGKLFQRNSFSALSFERDYRSYFPLAVNVRDGHEEVSVPVSALEPGQRIIARHGELIPADCRLLSTHALLDFSYVTGESDPVEASRGDQVWAGGRVVSGAIELVVLRDVSQSYLTRLWNQDLFHGPATDDLSLLANRFSRWFTAAVVSIAVLTALYWLQADPTIAIHAATSVLIIACPCALALSTPFTTGAAMNLLARVGLYLREGSVVEKLAGISTIVFDKTGTLTSTHHSDVVFAGTDGDLTAAQKLGLAALLSNSVHPLSRKLLDQLPAATSPEVAEYLEAPGLGISGRIDKTSWCVGSRQWLIQNGVPLERIVAGTGSEQLHADDQDPTGATVHIAANSIHLGMYRLGHAYRGGLSQLMAQLRRRYQLMLLSGDNDRERQRLLPLMGDSTQMHFSQSPEQKLATVQRLEQSQSVMMVGDGLNDAGALRGSSVGIAVSEQIAAFSPACDGILDADAIHRLPAILHFARLCLGIVIASFILSLAYNIIGLSFAVRGNLSPLLSAVLMPLSSVSVIAFTAIATRGAARWTGLRP